MDAVLIALFVSASAQGLPASKEGECFADAPCATVRTLAGKAAQIDAVMIGEPVEVLRPAVHIEGQRKPAFDPASKRPAA